MTNLQAGVILQLTVVIGIVLGAVVLDEHLTFLQTVGSAPALAGAL